MNCRIGTNVLRIRIVVLVVVAGIVARVSYEQIATRTHQHTRKMRTRALARIAVTTIPKPKHKPH